MKILFSGRKNQSALTNHVARSKSAHYRQILADILAMVIFCTVTNFLIEVFISHMTWRQSLYARLLAIPVNALVAPPYGYYRDYLLRLFTHIGHIGNLLVNIFAYITFLTPFYIIILIFSGATKAQIISAASLNVLVSVFAGGLYGHFMNYCRYLLHADVSVHHR